VTGGFFPREFSNYTPPYRAENSPAIHGWVSNVKRKKSRKGRQKFFRPWRDLMMVELFPPALKRWAIFTSTPPGLGILMESSGYKDSVPDGAEGRHSDKRIGGKNKTLSLLHRIC
jgi:hypothetical protein